MSHNNRNVEKVVCEALRLSECTIESQFKAALAADTRAVGFLGLSVAAITIFSNNKSDGEFLALPFVVGNIFLFLACIIFTYTIRAVKIYGVGYKFNAFEKEIEDKILYSDVIKELGEYNDHSIEENNKVMEKNGKCFNIGIVLAFIGYFILLFSNHNLF